VNPLSINLSSTSILAKQLLSRSHPRRVGQSDTMKPIKNGHLKVHLDYAAEV
jgi:hypothetical protein